MTADPDRTYRAVRLRADEAKYIERHTPIGDLCPHLDIFHNTGMLLDGCPWRACLICGEGREEHDSFKEEMRERRTDREKRDRRSDLLVMLIVGLVVGVIIGMAFYSYCVWRVS